MAGWIGLSILGGILVFPLAWVNAALARWFCRNTAFSDDTTAEFRGTGGEVVVWYVFLLVIGLAQQFLLGTSGGEGDARAALPVMLVTYLAMLAIALTLIKWFVHNVRLTPGPPLTFTGSFLTFAGWYVLLALSFLTIIGWAWAATAMYRWIARHVKGQSIGVEFRASGVAFLWRSLVFVLLSFPVVTLPWTALWFTRWLMENVVLLRGVEPEEFTLSSTAPAR